MKQTLEEAARKYADENCWIPEELHDSEIPDYIEHFAKHFTAGAEWQAEQSPWISVEMAIPKDNSPGVVQVRTVDGKEGEMAARRVVYNVYPYIKTGYVTHWRVFNE